MIVSEVYRRKLPAVGLRAVSQNLGHKDIMTTLSSYGKLSQHEQGEFIREVFAAPDDGDGDDDDWPKTVVEINALLQKKGIL